MFRKQQFVIALIAFFTPGIFPTLAIQGGSANTSGLTVETGLQGGQSISQDAKAPSETTNGVNGSDDSYATACDTSS